MSFSGYDDDDLIDAGETSSGVGTDMPDGCGLVFALPMIIGVLSFVLRFFLKLLFDIDFSLINWILNIIAGIFD